MEAYGKCTRDCRYNENDFLQLEWAFFHHFRHRMRLDCLLQSEAIEWARAEDSATDACSSPRCRANAKALARLVESPSRCGELPFLTVEQAECLAQSFGRASAIRMQAHQDGLELVERERRLGRLVVVDIVSPPFFSLPNHGLSFLDHRQDDPPLPGPLTFWRSTAANICPIASVLVRGDDSGLAPHTRPAIRNYRNNEALPLNKLLIL
ncbi:hypothetical protein ACRQ5Q_21185 [Bradyrhizobium sp. PMVTL-01]|uniref:hypothetical protein n=1 Tax=Bradyrhizobium sp. PMVTL-01 TaxID=3434999 RepID=UPI003F706A83